MVEFQNLRQRYAGSMHDFKRLEALVSRCKAARLCEKNWQSYAKKHRSREHKTISRIQSSYNNHWEIACNGVIIDLTPTDEQDFKFLREPKNSTWKKLAGIKVRAVNNPRDNDLNVVPMINDPIPLLWTGKINY